MHEKGLRLRTYRQVWRLEQVIYQIERVRLPFPITFRQIGVFGVTLLAMLVISRIPPLQHTSALIRYLLIPGVTAWYLTSRRLDGKLPHRWLWSLITWWLSPQRLNRLRPMSAGKRVLLKADPGYRIASINKGEG